MSAFKNIAILGRGELGTAVLEHLLKANFKVTVLTRKRASLGDVPAGVEVAEVDYDSVDSLAAALDGIDAVVSTVAMQAIAGQKTSIEAAVKAGVKRFIPADFGSLNNDPECQDFPLYTDVVAIQRLLEDKARAGVLEYTRFGVGAFLEYVTGHLVLDIGGRSVELVDGGVHPFSTTSVDSIGKAVAGALKRPGETRNRVLFIQDAAVTQAQVLAIAKAQTPGEPWTETHIEGGAALQRANDNLKVGDVDFHKAAALLGAALLSAKYKVKYEHLDNELLGLGQLSEAEVEERIVALIKAKRY